MQVCVCECVQLTFSQLGSIHWEHVALDNLTDHDVLDSGSSSEEPRQIVNICIGDSNAFTPWESS